MEKQLFIGGFGGQGVAVIGKLIGKAATRDGLHASYFPEYGVQMRNGTTWATVIASDAAIPSVCLSKFEYMAVMDKVTYHNQRQRIIPGGTMILNTSLVKDTVDRTDITVYQVPVNDIAAELGNDKTANIVMLGAIWAATQMCSKESLISEIENMFAGKEKVIELNKRAFDKGAQCVLNK